VVVHTIFIFHCDRFDVYNNDNNYVIIIIACAAPIERSTLSSPPWTKGLLLRTRIDSEESRSQAYVGIGTCANPFGVGNARIVDKLLFNNTSK